MAMIKCSELEMLKIYFYVQVVNFINFYSDFSFCNNSGASFAENVLGNSLRGEIIFPV